MKIEIKERKQEETYSRARKLLSLDFVALFLHSLTLLVLVENHVVDLVPNKAGDVRPRIADHDAHLGRQTRRFRIKSAALGDLLL